MAIPATQTETISNPVVRAISYSDELSPELVTWIADCLDDVNGMITKHVCDNMTVDIEFRKGETNSDKKNLAYCLPTHWSYCHGEHEKFPTQNEIYFNVDDFPEHYASEDAKDTIIHEIFHAIFFHVDVFESNSLLVEDGGSLWFTGNNAQAEFNRLYQLRPQFHDRGIPLTAEGSHLGRGDSYRAGCCIPGFPSFPTASAPVMWANDATGRQLVLKLTLEMARDLGFEVNLNHPGVNQDYTIPSEALENLPYTGWTTCQEHQPPYHCTHIQIYDFSRHWTETENSEIRSVSFTVKITDFSIMYDKWYYQVKESVYPEPDDPLLIDTDIPDDAIEVQEDFGDPSGEISQIITFETPTLGYYVLCVWAVDAEDVILDVDEKRFAVFTQKGFCVAGAPVSNQLLDPNGYYIVDHPTPAWVQDVPGTIDRVGHHGRQFWTKLTGLYGIWGWRSEQSSLSVNWVIDSDGPGDIESDGIIAISEETEGEPWDADWLYDGLTIEPGDAFVCPICVGCVDDITITDADPQVLRDVDNKCYVDVILTYDISLRKKSTDMCYVRAEVLLNGEPPVDDFNRVIYLEIPEDSAEASGEVSLSLSGDDIFGSTIMLKLKV